MHVHLFNPPQPAPVLVQPSSSTGDTCPAQQKWSHLMSSSIARGWTTWRSDTRPPLGHSSNQQQYQSGQPKHLAGEGNQERNGKEFKAGSRKRKNWEAVTVTLLRMQISFLHNLAKKKKNQIHLNKSAFNWLIHFYSLMTPFLRAPITYVHVSVFLCRDMNEKTSVLCLF